MTCAENATANQTTGLILYETGLFLADYYGNWLLKAAEAHGYLERALQQDAKLSDKLDIWFVGPGNVALELMSKLLGGGNLALDLPKECPELVPGFCALAALGFFIVRGRCAEMFMPHRISEADVVRVFSRLSLIDRKQWETPQTALAHLAAL